MPIRVLAIDDEADILRMISIKLGKAGYEVITAKDGQEGVEKALSERPDVMLVDVMMPKKNGYQVISEVKENLEEAPVYILLTAKSEAEDIKKGFSSGADDFITKPFSPQELIERININLIRKGKISP